MMPRPALQSCCHDNPLPGTALRKVQTCAHMRRVLPRHVVLPVLVLLRQGLGHGVLLGQRGHSLLAG